MRLIFFCFLFILVEKAFSQPAYCQLSGPVIEEKDPARANFRIFKEETESFADLVVFNAENALFADKPGKWHFTDSRALAKFSVIWVEERSKADFSIYFTSTESFAGCQNSR
jgi:hypothetical protein